MAKYTVTYPVSKQEFEAEGRLCVGIPPGMDVFCVGFTLTADCSLRPDCKAGTVLMLDPRCLVKDDTGVIVYNPRDVMGMPGFMQEFRDWLVAHPAWGAV